MCEPVPGSNLDDLICYFQERERRSPPFTLSIHPFSEGVSALQIYCIKEGVKVNTNLSAIKRLRMLLACCITFCMFFSPQDVCIPDLIKLLDILGDNGVN